MLTHKYNLFEELKQMFHIFPFERIYNSVLIKCVSCA